MTSKRSVKCDNFVTFILAHTGMTQKDLESETGITQSRISRLCNAGSDDDLFRKMKAWEYFLITQAFYDAIGYCYDVLQDSVYGYHRGWEE